MKYVFLILLVFVLPLGCAENNAKVENEQTQLVSKDSLIISRDTFKLNEKIEFTAKVAKTIGVPTIVCSCGNKDFYYKVYSMRKDGWKLSIDHTDNWNQPQCACKIMSASIINGHKYSIEPINKTGTYYIEIANLTSKPFVVKK